MCVIVAKLCVDTLTLVEMQSNLHCAVLQGPPLGFAEGLYAYDSRLREEDPSRYEGMGPAAYHCEWGCFYCPQQSFVSGEESYVEI